MKKFTICCLFYGDYPHLAERLLQSLGRMDLSARGNVRVGLNNVGMTTRRLVHERVEDLNITDIYNGAPPYHKYPLMRRMFHEDGLGNQRTPIATSYVMWFDDDSCLAGFNRAVARDMWFEHVDVKMQTHDLIGAPFYMHLRGKQHQFIEDQPWYNGKPVKYRQKMSFITGGWWTIRTGILHKHDWPPPNFEHNGGDVMLGALCDQHGYKLGRFTTDLFINANNTGKCSSAKRRGFSQTSIGVDYVRKPKEPEPTLFDVLDGKHGTT